GQTSLPTTNSRSTSSTSTLTVSTGASVRHLKRPSRLRLPNEGREGRYPTRRDHGAVAHEKGQPKGLPSTSSSPSAAHPAAYVLIPSDAEHQPSRAEVAAYHHLRLAEKAVVAIGFVAEREADQVVSDPYRDEAPGGEPVRGQAIPGGEHVAEQVREIVVALPLLPLEFAAARRGVEDLAEPRYAAENLRVRVDRLLDEGACMTGQVELPELIH